MTKKQNKKPLILFSLLAVLAQNACTKKEDVTDTLRIRLQGDPPSIDWNIATDNVSKEVITNIQEGLLVHDQKTELRLALAASWERSTDEKTYTFKLRDNVQWSDGKPLIAQHFVDSWERLINTKTASEYAYFLFDVENAEKYNKGEVKDFSQVGIKALDEKTLQVKLSKPVAYWIHIPTFWVTFPIRKDVVEAHGDKWTKPGKIVTLGPYLLKTWEHDSKVLLEKNPTYFNAAELSSSPQKVEYRIIKEGSTAVSLFQNKAIDIVRDLPAIQVPTLSKTPEFSENPWLRGYYYGFNVKDPAVSDINVRKALAHAIDRDELVKAVSVKVKATSSWIQEGLLGFSPDRGIKFNPELAKKHWAMAKNKPQTFEVWFNQDELNKTVAENIQNQWSRILGINVKLVSQEWKVYLKSVATKAPAVFRLGWGADYPDPNTFMDMWFCGSGNNHTGYCDKKFDQLVMDAAGKADPARRKPLYDEAQKKLLEDEVAIVPLFSQSNMHLVSPRVDGFKPNLLAGYHVKHIQLKKAQ